MNTANPTLNKLSAFCASLLLAGVMGSSLVMANEPTGNSATGSSHGTMPNDGTSIEGKVRQDCPDDLKEGDECPEGWMPEGSRQDMPEQDGGVAEEENDAMGNNTGEGTSGGSMGGDSDAAGTTEPNS